MYFPIFLSLATATIVIAADSRFILYYDQWHARNIPAKSLTAGVTHVMMSFANSSLFASQPQGEYKPFQPVEDVRALFDDTVQVCLAIGGWGDTAGFTEAVKSDKARKNFAKNIASTVDTLGFDCVDIDWEYPGGNGDDYKSIPNEKKEYEIRSFPRLLEEVKKAIGDKELSIAVPGLSRDMITYTSKQVPEINHSVDFVNVMTYDLMNRRDHYTTHHTSLRGTFRAIDTYISLGFPASKLVFGIPFYAKWFTTKNGYVCDQPIGCPTELLEYPVDGSDTGKSGSMSFEAANFVVPPKTLTLSPNATCGAGTPFICGDGLCCGQTGWCGETSEYCGAGCQSAFGECKGPDIFASFHRALEGGRTDDVDGGQWFWDAETRFFWSWDTPELIARKISMMAKTRGVKSVMAWALGLDSHDWSHLKAMQLGFSKNVSYRV